MIKPIRSDDDHRAALNRINVLWGADINTPEGDELDVLLTLVDKFESEHYPIDAPDPVEAIKFRMDQQGLKPADLTVIIGGKSRVSEILGKKRSLTLPMIRRLSADLNIPAEVLTPEYKLDKKNIAKTRAVAAKKAKKISSEKQRKIAKAAPAAAKKAKAKKLAQEKKEKIKAPKAVKAKKKVAPKKAKVKRSGATSAFRARAQA